MTVSSVSLIIRSVAWACCVAAMLGLSVCAAETESERFRAILELAEIGPEVLAELGQGPDYSDDDWQLLMQIFGRLQQFGNLDSRNIPKTINLSLWDEKARKENIGQLFNFSGIVDSVQEVPLPKKMSELYGRNTVFRCRLGFLINDAGDLGHLTVLTTDIPSRWHKKKKLHESVEVLGTLLQGDRDDDDLGWHTLFLANRFAWYPDKDVPTGQILLARHGMDVALFDEVRHRKPFVKPEVSREGEAFYAALTALAQVEPQELVQQAKENVARVAKKWLGQQEKLEKNHQALKACLAAATEAAEQTTLRQQIKQAKKERGLAAAVVQQAEAGRSSVAPMFLQPEENVGELFFFEGTARRAVRIAAEGQTGIETYYEIEVFTNDSQNLPIVCCVARLPEGFPTGDAIREPVRLAGVFFKLWRYRSRKLIESPGETTGQRQLYTPVVLGNVPTWLNKSSPQKNPWALWGGLAFLGALAVLWMSMMGLARRDRRARAQLRHNKKIDL